MAKITLQTDSEYTRQLMEAGGKTSKNVINAPHVLLPALWRQMLRHTRARNDLGFLGPGKTRIDERR